MISLGLVEDAVVGLKRWGRKTLDDMNNTRLDPSIFIKFPVIGHD